MYLLNILGMRTHRPEGFLKKLVVPLKPSGRFPSFLRRYSDKLKRLPIWVMPYLDEKYRFASIIRQIYKNRL
jgi:hypothetical protein